MNETDDHLVSVWNLNHKKIHKKSCKELLSTTNENNQFEYYCSRLWKNIGTLEWNFNELYYKCFKDGNKYCIPEPIEPRKYVYKDEIEGAIFPNACKYLMQHISAGPMLEHYCAKKQVMIPKFKEDKLALMYCHQGLNSGCAFKLSDLARPCLDEVYSSLVAEMNSNDLTSSDLKRLSKEFIELENYLDSKQYANDCLKKTKPIKVIEDEKRKEEERIQEIIRSEKLRKEQQVKDIKMIIRLITILSVIAATIFSPGTLILLFFLILFILQVNKNFDNVTLWIFFVIFSIILFFFPSARIGVCIHFIAALVVQCSDVFEFRRI
jgi:hypothetical protein